MLSLGLLWRPFACVSYSDLSGRDRYQSIVRRMPSRTVVRALQPNCSLARDGSARHGLAVSHSRFGIVEKVGEKSSLNRSRAMPASSPMLVDLPVPMLKDSP